MSTSPLNLIAVTAVTERTRSPLTPLVNNSENVARSTTHHDGRSSVLRHTNTAAASAAVSNSGGIAVGGGEESSSPCRRKLFPSINEGIEDSLSSPSNGDRTSLKRNYGAVSGGCEGDEEEGVVLSSGSDSNKSHQIGAASSTDDDHYATNEFDDEKFIPWGTNDDSVGQSVSHLPAKDLRGADRFMVENVLKRFNKSQFCPKEADSDASNFQPTALTAAEECWYSGISAHVKEQWELTPTEERKKLKGRINPNPPQCYIASAHVMVDGKQEKKIVAAMTSLRSGGEYKPGKDGEKQRVFRTRKDGTQNPESVEGKLGGRYNDLYGLEVNESAENYRGSLTVKRVLSDADPEFITATIEAKKNEAFFESLMEKIEADSKKNNGLPQGDTIQYFLLEPAEDCTNEDEQLDNETAKAKGISCVYQAIGTYWYEETSDEIPRLKDERLTDRMFNLGDFSHLRSGDTFKLNGYIIRKIESDEEYDAAQVTKNFDTKAAGGKENLPSPLPKRMKIGGTRRNKRVQKDLYLIEPAEDCTNKDEQLDNETAKAKGFKCLTAAIGKNWDEETSDEIPRLKESKKGQYWNKSDIVAHLRSGDTFKVNGYNITNIESDEEYDASQVTKNFDTKAAGGLPKSLPKRKKKMNGPE